MRYIVTILIFSYLTFLVFPNNFIASVLKVQDDIFIVNVIKFSNLFIYIHIKGSTVFSPCFLNTYSK